MAMKYLQAHAKGGYVGHHNYILNQSTEDILIFGSSRAIHHYNPQIIKDSLGMTCYNCGQDGNGIVLFYGWWQIIKDRYTPKMIVYDVNPRFDLLEGEDNHKYLGWLKSEYDIDKVKQIFADVDPSEKFKMLSMMYRYNSKFLQNITDYFHPMYGISQDGYLPLIGDMDKMKIKEQKTIVDYSYDQLKLSYIESFINDCKYRGITLIITSSPIWYGRDERELKPLKDLCNRESIPFYDFSNDDSYVHNDEMFKDGNHLNNKGADEFTKEICKIINID